VKLKKLAPDLRKRLDKSNSQIVLQLTLQSADKMKQHACRLEESGTPRLRTLQDLYGNREECRPALDFMVERRREEPRDTDKPKRRVRIRTRDDCLPSSEYFLLGSTPITSDDLRLTISSSVTPHVPHVVSLRRSFVVMAPLTRISRFSPREVSFQVMITNVHSRVDGPWVLGRPFEQLQHYFRVVDDA
jgi:hypothetical protein